MKFSWDPEKRERNLVKHHFDFIDAERVFAGAVYVFEDRRFDYPEQRFIGLGLLEDLTVVVVFVEREDDEIRILSMRKATRHERQLYYRKISD